MARIGKHMMTLALVGALAYPAAGWAIQVDSKNPRGGFDLNSFMQQPEQMMEGNALVNAISVANGLDLGKLSMEDLGKALVVGMVKSALSGNFDPKSMFGEMAGVLAIGAMGGIQGGTMGGIGNFGGVGLGGGTGLGGGIMGGIQQSLGGVLTQVVTQALGGIQGGSTGGGTNFGGTDLASLGGTGVRVDEKGNVVEFVENPTTGEWEEKVVQ